MGRAFRKFHYDGYLSSGYLPKNYIDPRYSGYLGAVKDPTALVLVHKSPAGILRAEYCGYEKGKKKSAASLYTSILYRVMISEGEDLILLPADEEMTLFFENICTERKGRYLISATLDDPKEAYA